MNDPQTPIQTLAEAIRAELTLWALCLYCGKTHLNDPRALAAAIARDGDDRLVTVAAGFECHGCRRRGTVLVPTPRTMMSFDRTMGIHNKS